jgi:hypothetical protein
MQRVYKNYFRDAIEGVERVEAKLHQMNFSSKHGYDAIVERLGAIPYRLPAHLKNKSLRYKAEHIYKNKFSDFFLKIAIGPLPNKYGFYGANSYWTLIPKGDVPLERYHAFLTWLNERIALKISRVEYTTDQYCLAPSMVSTLFFVERRYVVVPYQRRSKTFGGQEEEYDINFLGWKNHVSHFGESDKAYERGDDKDRDNEGWKREDLNRVRLEHTADRNELKRKYNIDSLADFIADPHFADINRDRWKFKHFIKGKLPRYWEPFNTEDENEYAGTMMNELIEARGNIKNVRQYLGPIAELKPLEEKILAATEEFDPLWHGLCTTT